MLEKTGEEQIGLDKAGINPASAGRLWHKERKCPECKSKMVRRSHMRGLLERGLLKPLGVKAFRCEKCDARFYRFGSSLSQKKAQPPSSDGGAATLK
jgi:hypothetical protein